MSLKVEITWTVLFNVEVLKKTRYKDIMIKVSIVIRINIPIIDHWSLIHSRSCSWSTYLYLSPTMTLSSSLFESTSLCSLLATPSTTSTPLTLSNWNQTNRNFSKKKLAPKKIKVNIEYNKYIGTPTSVPPCTIHNSTLSTFIWVTIKKISLVFINYKLSISFISVR